MKKIIILLVAIITLSACEEYLDKIPDSDGMVADDVFTNYLNFRKFEDRMYKDMHDYLANYDYSYISAVCDEGFMDCDWETLPVVQAGDWIRSYSLAQALQFSTIWGSWESIRIANLSLEKLSLIKDATPEQLDELKGQAHFMRAWYYFEFLKRQGGMPYLTKALEGTDDFAFERLSYHETALKIVADCDTASQLLPQIWDNANLGRPTQGAAMTLKAAALIFSASPTNNPENDNTKWEAAANAAWDVINFAETTGTYKLVECHSTDELSYKAVQNVTPNDTIKTILFTGGYDSIFNFTAENDEIIWEYFSQMQNGGRYITFTTPTLGEYGIIQGYSPSQNIVDLFETSNGLAIEDDGTYEDQNPYVDRDPRFYHNILFNGQRWSSQSDYYLGLYNGGLERQDLKHYSKTGYLARKFWVNNVDQFSTETHPISHSIYFRYTEVLMWYAEACNEIGGPNYTLPGTDRSALDAVNEIRSRVNMPNVDAMYLSDKDSFRERIKNERAVEFYLEGKRFFDLSRWGDASKLKHKEVYAITIQEDLTKPTGFVFNRDATPINTLTFDSKHYRWPIPLDDANMFEEFKQNPGW